MGGKGSGRKVDSARQRKAVQLRARGLTLADIGRRLGTSRQGAAYILAHTGDGVTHVPRRCSTCDRAIPRSGTAGRTTGGVRCLGCLNRLRDATFAQRLQSHRVARGLTRTALGRLSGMGGNLITQYERGRHLPLPATLARLVRVLGPRLVGVG
jgi:transcriptional regulator with XRE-family HTH domain